MLDSGASSHFLLTSPVLNKIIAQNPINIRLPDGSRSNCCILLSWTIQTYQLQHVRVILSLDLLLTPLFQLSSSVTHDVRSLSQSLALGLKSDIETASFGQEKSVQEQARGWYH